MIVFNVGNKSKFVNLEYQSDMNDNQWIWYQLSHFGRVVVSKVFTFTLDDLILKPEPNQSFKEFVYYFRLGTSMGKYVKIPGRRLGIKNDVHISREITLKRTIFAAERNVSIFRHLSRLLDHTDPIKIGGEANGAIPKEVFEELLKRFPNTWELNHYARARIHTILSQYLDGMKDARQRYEEYLKRKPSITSIQKLDFGELKQFEIEKYSLIRDSIDNALRTKLAWTEKEWQQLMVSFLLLLFPKYIRVLENVRIFDYYSNSNNKTDRYIDLALVDANGNLDIIEVKRPFDDNILRTGTYRGNYIPTSDLSGSIMQAEKYLFHLSKWGVQGEKELTTTYETQLPTGMKIKISNPKAIIIVGRDQIGGANMSGIQLLDFEIIKRKYAHMMDIITYDDLLRRLDNTIAALKMKST